MRRWSHRLAVRTSDSHSGNTGSIPVGTAIICICWEPANTNYVNAPGIEHVTKGSNRRRKADGSTPVMCHAHNEPR